MGRDPWEELRPRRRARVATALRRLWAPVRRALAAVGLRARNGLHECSECGACAVTLVDTRMTDDGRMAYLVRCGQCGESRVTVPSKAEAIEFEASLREHHESIERDLARLEALLMQEEIDGFAEALRRDLIDAGDFAPPRLSRGSTGTGRARARARRRA